MSKITKIPRETVAYLKANNLHSAIHSLHDVVYGNPEWLLIDDFERIEENYQMMVDYMKRGFKDDKRFEVYEQQKVSLNSFMQRIARKNAEHEVEFVKAKSKAFDLDISFNEIKNKLESFITDTALIGLENNVDVRNYKMKEMFQAHQDLMDKLFCRIWISDTWNSETADDMTDLLLSSTIESNDIQLIISAVMLGSIEFFDYNKFRVLASVYMKSTDENVRQRAFVGWVFALQCRTYETQEMHRIIKEMLADPKTVDELMELQVQIVFCKNAERDRDMIQNEIMPDLMKNSNIRITRFGLEEKEDDPMKDILDPNADERSAEKLEKGIERIMKMQNSGVDIYFGGFSMMKNFPFFRTMSNWFCPFYIEHPDISSQMVKEGMLKLANIFINRGPFCDSDKYSLCFAINQMIDHLDPSMKEMMLSAPDGLMTPSDLADMKDTPTYIRRNYLQSLFRMYKVSSFKSEINDPFTFPVLFEDRMFASLSSKFLIEIAEFMKIHHNMESAKNIISIIDPPYDYNYYMAKSEINPDYSEYEKALRLKPDDEKALVKYAEKLLILDENPFEAAVVYRKLAELYPNKKYETDLCSCLVDPSVAQYDEALKILYKVTFEHPEYMKAARVIAWCLFCMGKSEQAEKYYSTILRQKKVYRPDFLNAGHVAWVNNDIKTALSRYKSYASMFGNLISNNAFIDSVNSEFNADKQRLESYGLTKVDIQLMIDIIIDSHIS
jgi:tetratricopeptide (TPR) repeat protein